jgi:hypothetical protein
MRDRDRDRERERERVSVSGISGNKLCDFCLAGRETVEEGAEGFWLPENLRVFFTAPRSNTKDRFAGLHSTLQC